MNDLIGCKEFQLNDRNRIWKIEEVNENDYDEIDKQFKEMLSAMDLQNSLFRVSELASPHEQCAGVCVCYPLRPCMTERKLRNHCQRTDHSEQWLLTYTKCIFYSASFPSSTSSFRFNRIVTSRHIFIIAFYAKWSLELHHQMYVLTSDRDSMLCHSILFDSVHIFFHMHFWDVISLSNKSWKWMKNARLNMKEIKKCQSLRRNGIFIHLRWNSMIYNLQIHMYGVQRDMVCDVRVCATSWNWQQNQLYQ